MESILPDSLRLIRDALLGTPKPSSDKEINRAPWKLKKFKMKELARNSFSIQLQDQSHVPVSTLTEKNSSPEEASLQHASSNVI